MKSGIFRLVFTFQFHFHSESQTAYRGCDFFKLNFSIVVFFVEFQSLRAKNDFVDLIADAKDIKLIFNLVTLILFILPEMCTHSMRFIILQFIAFFFGTRYTFWMGLQNRTWDSIEQCKENRKFNVLTWVKRTVISSHTVESTIIIHSFVFICTAMRLTISRWRVIINFLLKVHNYAHNLSFRLPNIEFIELGTKRSFVSTVPNSFMNYIVSRYRKFR